MANVKNNSATQETRRRLLAAAGEVFAFKGFHAATIKDITDLAQASMASVNYHFRDKAELYTAVLRRIEEDSAAILPPPGLLQGPPAQRLRQLIDHLCNTIICHDKPPWEQVLMMRELGDPSPAIDSMIDHVLRPLNDEFAAIVAELLDVPVTAPTVGLHVASVVGQVFHFTKRLKLLAKLHPQLGEPPNIDDIADHIVDFSLAAMGVRSSKAHVARTRTVEPASTGRPRKNQLS